MHDTNKQNLHYFESDTMRGLFEAMNQWQVEHQKRLLSLSIQADAGTFACIALTNPTEVVITSLDGQRHADIMGSGSLKVFT
jgi:hypothetical protein